ncbi:MAG: threonylcarbamoyl-AMP synthase [Clostridia bacterium]|nr:threonylcarbamoyl-AMP synthase [Clostridia bacterium]MBO7319455.1 threonylcarbamoyl-AMP synthase [Clostridia bacterium]
MKTLHFEIHSPENDDISKVASILKDGGIAAIPTETVYGLAGNALKGECVKKIYRAKGRPSDNPLIVHISDISQWAPLVKSIPESALALAEKFWPGPLTIILPKSDIIPTEISGGLGTVAVRMPSDEIAKAIISACGFPLAAPSANTSGKPSPTCASHVTEDLDGKIDAIVDSGECSVGIESTVITLATDIPRLLRPGGITPEMLTEVLGEIEIDDAVYNKLHEGAEAASPGMKYKHYSPDAKVLIVKGSFDNYKKYIEDSAEEGDVALCFEEEVKQLSIKCITYGRKDDPSSQAKNIFDALRKVDEEKAKTVYARFPENEGIGLAVFNRLVRAAAFNIIEV